MGVEPTSKRLMMINLNRFWLSSLLSSLGHLCDTVQVLLERDFDVLRELSFYAFGLQWAQGIILTTDDSIPLQGWLGCALVILGATILA